MRFIHLEQSPLPRGIMKISRVIPLALMSAIPAASAQTSAIFSAIQSVQSAVSQTRQMQSQPTAPNGASGAQQSMSEEEKQAQEDSAKITAADQKQYQAQRQREQAEAKRASDEDDAEALAVENASIRRDAERQQQAAAESGAMPDLCPNVNRNLTIGAFLVACKNAGATEQQLLARLGALPMMQQALYADIIQDIYDNNVTDQKKGDAIAKYDARCTSQNNCQRIAW
jgi:hypothetical protein